MFGRLVSFVTGWAIQIEERIPEILKPGGDQLGDIFECGLLWTHQTTCCI
jgi:hypothetical protein